MSNIPIKIIIHLTLVLGVTTRIEYLDGRPFDIDKGLAAIVCPEIQLNSSTNGIPPFTVHLLYRPGHYDILYPL